jgi:hypothetical protein
MNGPSSIALIYYEFAIHRKATQMLSGRSWRIFAASLGALIVVTGVMAPRKLLSEAEIIIGMALIVASCHTLIRTKKTRSNLGDLPWIKSADFRPKDNENQKNSSD